MSSLTPALIQSQTAERWQAMRADLVERMQQRGMTKADLAKRAAVKKETINITQSRARLSGFHVLSWLRIQHALAQSDTEDAGLLVGGIALSKALESLLAHMRMYVRVECDLRMQCRSDLGHLTGLSNQVLSLFFRGKLHGNMQLLVGQQFIFDAMPRPDRLEPNIKQARITAGLSQATVAAAIGKSKGYVRRLEDSEYGEHTEDQIEQRLVAMRAVATLSRARRAGPDYLPRLPIELVDVLWDSLVLFVGADMTDHLHQTAFRQAQASMLGHS